MNISESVNYILKSYENKYKNLEEAKTASLYLDDEVTNKKGIYRYVLDGLEKHLSLRTFTDSQKLKVYNAQGGICPRCVSQHKPTATKVWKIEEMEGDHITP